MATICLEGIPPGSQIGLDLHSWQSGPRFRGLRGVPAGLHCLHLTIAEIVTTKYALWLDLVDGDTLAFKWDRGRETLEEIEASYDLSTKDTTAFAVFLIQCPAEEDRDWASITQRITPELIAEIIPLRQLLTSSTSSNTDPSSSDLDGLQRISDLDEEPEFKFCAVDLKRSWPKGAVGREVTEMALDKTWLLQDTLRRIGGENKFLGQFEFCFISVLLYSSFAAFEQWNQLSKLTTTAKTAVTKLPSFFCTFLALLQVSSFVSTTR